MFSVVMLKTNRGAFVRRRQQQRGRERGETLGATDGCKNKWITKEFVLGAFNRRQADTYRFCTNIVPQSTRARYVEMMTTHLWALIFDNDSAGAGYINHSAT